MRTLSGWLSNALDRALLPLGEPAIWVLAITLVWVAWGLSRRAAWSAGRWVAYGVVSLWLIAALGITMFPLTESGGFGVRDRWSIRSVIPLAGTIESFGNMRDRTMSPDELAAQESRIAEDMNIPVDEVNMSPVVTGISLSTALRDPLGNLLLFLPFGLLAPVALRIRGWRRITLIAAALSLAIELSQLLFGVGSLGTIDDVIFNTAGALVGYGLYSLAKSQVAPRLAAPDGTA